MRSNAPRSSGTLPYALWVISLILISSVSTVAHTAEPLLILHCADKLSGGEKSECKLGVQERHEEEIRIKVVTSNTGLISPESSLVILPAGKDSVTIPLKTFPAQIKSSVTVAASAIGFVSARETIEVVPALISSVSLSQTSFVGTIGGNVLCVVKLKAPAPPGGIQLYLSPLSVQNFKNLKLHIPNPTIAAGRNSGEFNIEYTKIADAAESLIDHASAIVDFNTVTRKVELIVALDPQLSTTWTPIVGTANKVTFDVIPLRITSFSIQPSTLSKASEGLASFSLNAAPGPGESIRLLPARATNKFWVTPVSASCSPATASQLEGSLDFPLTSGTTNYNFKVCSLPTTTSINDIVSAIMRSGRYQAPIAIQP